MSGCKESKAEETLDFRSRAHFGQAFETSSV